MENTDNREMRIARTIKAPIDLIWNTWSDPKHIVHWWGPNGFTSTIHKMDFREGGEWELTMQGPDGTNYPNRSIFREIIPMKKIVFEHFSPHFTSTILFESSGDETRIDWTGLFDSEEIFKAIVRSNKADEGQKQNIERLEKYLAKLLSEPKTG